MIYEISQQKGYAPAKLASILKLQPFVYISTLSTFLHQSSLAYDGTDPHPPIDIRLNGIVGNFDWLYTLGLDINPGDKVYISPEKRIRLD
jgi:hypothetical protein